MPSMTTPSSGGTSETGDMSPQNGGAPGSATGYSMAGEIMVSRQESAALAAIHFGADATKNRKKALELARKESGLSHQQILRLESRANRARANGVTLKGHNIVLKPTALAKPAAPDEPGLLRGDNTDAMSDEEKETKAEKLKGGAAAAKAPGVMGRGYAGRTVSKPEAKTAAKKKPELAADKRK